MIVKRTISSLEQEHGIEMHAERYARNHVFLVAEYKTVVAIPYIDALPESIKQWFSEKNVMLLVTISIFNPSLLPDDDSMVTWIEEIKLLADFYGDKAEMRYGRDTYTSSALLDGDDLVAEWSIGQ